MIAQVSLKTGKNTKAIAEALLVEAKEGLPKVNVNILPAGEKLKIDIEAKNFIGLRAALNSFLGWASCAEGVINSE
ncbi:MAG: KEOPS complex subunit Pcc1 [Candidatus Thermoplasmatota archaeon]|nr:KEOPS complex subunit Pcc1 [Candidatus Thermoplasmatota archaeon]